MSENTEKTAAAQSSAKEAAARRADVTQEAFNAAVRKLQNENRELTVRSIRELTGGSNATLCRMLREHQRSAMMSSFKDIMPESYREGVIRLSTELYAHFSSLMAAERVRLQDSYDRMHAELAEEAQRNEAKTAEALAEAGALKRENASLRERIATLEETVSRLSTQNAALSSKVAARETDEHRQLMEAISGLRTELKSGT